MVAVSFPLSLSHNLFFFFFSVPDVADISINNKSAVNIIIHLSHPRTFKGDILGYFIEIYKGKRISTNKKPLKMYHIRCINCPQVKTQLFQSYIFLYFMNNRLLGGWLELLIYNSSFVMYFTI